MGNIETGSHAFVVRIWLEEGADATWRGHVTHVASGTHRYFLDLSELTAFIRPYLQDLRTDASGTGAE